MIIAGVIDVHRAHTFHGGDTFYLSSAIGSQGFLIGSKIRTNSELTYHGGTWAGKRSMYIHYTINLLQKDKFNDYRTNRWAWRGFCTPDAQSKTRGPACVGRK
ncbi:hypothetical protein LENED_011173 [Lentinula edodes]|uniref:Uncharacterized protein n=1 Tax=Lentinula edodes TaxID=5353 RepID=A0A1Q3EPD9_LENED|nr:hypothetical protein LENED_011173 [Lentinula edodes]